MKKPTKKYTDKSDDAYDKKNKIKEGSKKDMSLDKKRGVPETEMGMKPKLGRMPFMKSKMRNPSAY